MKRQRNGLSRPTLFRLSKRGLRGLVSVSCIAAVSNTWAAQMTVRLSGFPSLVDYALEEYIDQHHLFEKYAKQYGYDIETKRVPFTSGVAALEALMGGSVDQVLAGQMPVISAISKGRPVYLGSTVALGRNGHAFVVRKNGDIHSLDDLIAKKATIGTLIGSSGYQFLEMAFQEAYGKTAEELGMKVVNIPPAQAATMPKGLDAVVFWSNTPQIMVAKGVGEILLNDWGFTGPAWTAPPGPGKRLDWVKKSPFYPEGVIQYRNYTVWRKEFADANPKLIVAYNLAFAESVHALCQRNGASAAETAYGYVKPEWGDIPKDVALNIFAEDLTIGVRCWSYATYGDVRNIVFTAAWAFKNKYVDKPVTWDDAKKYFSFTAPLQREAWEKMGRNPSLSEMTKSSDVPDIRGYPTWMMDKWPDEAPPK